MSQTETKSAMTAEQQNVAMKSPEHLKLFLEQSGRKYLLFLSSDIVDALPWPTGVDLLIQMISCYRDHRRMQLSGLVETQIDPVTEEEVQVQLTKTEMPTIEELDRAIRYFIGEASKLDPDWKLENPPR